MKHSVLRWITVVTTLVMLLPVGSLAAATGPGRPESGNANG